MSKPEETNRDLSSPKEANPSVPDMKPWESLKPEEQMKEVASAVHRVLFPVKPEIDPERQKEVDKIVQEIARPNTYDPKFDGPGLDWEGSHYLDAPDNDLLDGALQRFCSFLEENAKRFRQQLREHAQKKGIQMELVQPFLEDSSTFLKFGNIENAGKLLELDPDRRGLLTLCSQVLLAEGMVKKIPEIMQWMKEHRVANKPSIDEYGRAVIKLQRDFEKHFIPGLDFKQGTSYLYRVHEAIGTFFSMQFDQTMDALSGIVMKQRRLYF